MSPKADAIYEFGPFQLNIANRVLYRQGQPVSLTPRAFDTLLALVENSGQILDKDQLMDMVWQDSFVEEANLAQNVSILRRVLGEGPRDHRYIVTVPRRGYCFVAPVRKCPEVGAIVGPVEPARGASMQSETPPETSARRGRKNLLLVGLVVMGSVAVCYLAFLRLASTPASAPVSPARTLAILPFRNLKPDPETDFLGISLADAVTSRLSRMGGIVIRPSSYMDRYRNGKLDDPGELGRELNTNTLLTGGFLKEGNNLRVTTELIDLNRDEILLREAIDVKYDSLMTIQDRVADSVARSLQLKLSVRQSAGTSTENAEAYQAYLKGCYFWEKRTGAAFKKAIGYFQQAIEKDQNFGLAYSRLADCYCDLAVSLIGGLSPQEAFPKAREAALRALEINNTLGEAHASLARIKAFYDWDWTGAEREHKRAIELDPNSPRVHQSYAIYLQVVGRPDEALAKMKRAIELDPLSLTINMQLGWGLYLSRRYDQAIEQLQKTLELDSNFMLAHLWLGRALLEKRMYRDAIAALEKAKELSANSPAVASDLGYAYAVSGRRGSARKMLAELREISKRQRMPAVYFARIYIGLGQKEEAFTWLEKAADERATFVAFLKSWPIVDSLRSDPRFTRLLYRMRLPA